MSTSDRSLEACQFECHDQAMAAIEPPEGAPLRQRPDGSTLSAILSLVFLWLVFRLFSRGRASPDAKRPAVGEPQDGAQHAPNAPVVTTFRWAFPSALSVVAVVGFVIWAAGEMYAKGFYGYFSLRLHEVGVTYLDLLERATLPIVLIALPLALLAVLFSGSRLRTNATQNIRDILADVKARTVWLTFVVGALVGAIVLSAEWLNDAGYRDADAISATNVANYNAGFLQATFGPPLVVAWARWEGPENQSPLVQGATSPDRSGAVAQDASERLNLVRLIGRNEEATFFLNLADCNVYRAPTALLTFQNPPISFVGTGSDPIPACPSRRP